MKNTQILSILFVILLFVQACTPNLDEDLTLDQGDNTVEEPNTSDAVGGMLSLVIPEGFEFKTAEGVTLTITDANPNVRYDVYAYNDVLETGETETIINEAGEEETVTNTQSDVLNQLVMTGMPRNGSLTQQLTLPSYFDKLYLRRKEGTRYSSAIVDIINGTATYIYSDSGKGSKGRLAVKDGYEDYLFAVNSDAQLFQVEPLTGVVTFLSDMPMGSYNAAIDQENNYLYSIGLSSPFPLMRFDILNDSWSIMGNAGTSAARMAFNPNDGLLYFSGGQWVRTVDPNNAAYLSYTTIEGLGSGQNNSGDLAFDANGTLYIASNPGLFRLDLINGIYQATRISPENLPFTPTSLTCDSEGQLWISNGTNLIIMDSVTGAWEYVYGIRANNGTTMPNINDLATYPYVQSLG